MIHGTTTDRQEDALRLCSYTATALPTYRVWKDNTHHTTIGSGRLPDSAHHSSGQQEWQRRHKELWRVERALFAQIRTLKAQIKQNCNRDVSMKRPLMPWIVRHSAYIMSRYAVHSNGCTSYFNRCFASLVRQCNMLPTVNKFPKLKPRLYNGIWLGATQPQVNPLLGSTTRLSEQGQSEGGLCLINTINNYWTVYTQVHREHPHQHCLHRLSRHLTMPAASKAPPSQKEATTSAAAEGKRQSAARASAQQTKQKRTTELTSPMATSPTHQKRPALPAPPPTSPARERDGTVAEGSAGKQQRTTTGREALERPTTIKLNAIKFTTKDGKQMGTIK